MADLGTLRVTLVANLRKFTAGMKIATASVKTFGSRVSRTMLRAGAMIRAFASRSLGLLKRFGGAMVILMLLGTLENLVMQKQE